MYVVHPTLAKKKQKYDVATLEAAHGNMDFLWVPFRLPPCLHNDVAVWGGRADGGQRSLGKSREEKEKNKLNGCDACLLRQPLQFASSCLFRCVYRSIILSAVRSKQTGSR